MHSNNLRLATTRDLPRGLFIDRWGTLCELPPMGFAKRPSEVEFIPGVLDALYEATRLGWNLYIIGNEEAVLPAGLPGVVHIDWDLGLDVGGCAVSQCACVIAACRPDFPSTARFSRSFKS